MDTRLIPFTDKELAEGRAYLPPTIEDKPIADGHDCKNWCVKYRVDWWGMQPNPKEPRCHVARPSNWVGMGPCHFCPFECCLNWCECSKDQFRTRCLKPTYRNRARNGLLTVLSGCDTYKQQKITNAIFSYLDFDPVDYVLHSHEKGILDVGWPEEYERVVAETRESKVEPVKKRSDLIS